MAATRKTTTAGTAPPITPPRLTRGEYWLLQTAVEYQMPLRIVGSDDVGLTLNKPGHGLSRAELVDTLLDLLRAGLIYVEQRDRKSRSATRRSLERAVAKSQVPSRTTYGLTPQGGAVWEAFAAPNWQRFVHDTGTPEDEWEVICADRDFLDRYLAAMRREGDLDASTLVIDEVRPWQATYWKKLPSGWRATFTWHVQDEPRWPAASQLADVWVRWR